MNYYNSFIIFLLFSSLLLQADFVSFIDEKVIIEKLDRDIQITLPFKIKKGYHIQAEKDVAENIIPTEIALQKNEDLKLIDQKFLIPKYDTVVLDKSAHKVLSDHFTVKLRIRRLRNSNESLILIGRLRYQACDDQKCFYPREEEFQVRLK